METKLIECKLIDAHKVSGDVRTFSKEFAVKLAASIKADGQLNPIVIRPNPLVPGRYINVAGKHRLYAMKNVLKEQFINASIDVTMDEAEAVLIADAENLWRNPLSAAQKAGALKRWHASWLAKNPPLEPKVSKSTQEGGDPVADPTDQADQSVQAEAATTEPEPAASAANEKDFDDKVAAVTGQSAASARRLKSLANAFTAEQLEVFTQCDVNQTEMHTIAKIKDEGKKSEVIALIASGMVVADAMKEVMGDDAPKKYNSGCASSVATEAKAATKVEREPELSDDDWFTTHCSEKAAMLGDQTKFKADAILFRSVSEFRHAFRLKGKKFLAETKKGGIWGPYFNLLNRFMNISHPKDWWLCSVCQGKGTNNDSTIPGVKCPKCFGGGFLLTTEEYP